MKTLFSTVGVCLLLGSAVFAQTDRGTITGTVLDPAGAVVPNASVVVKNLETAASYNASSTNTGNYTLASLPAGTYELTVSAAGFKKFVRPGITVQVAETVRADANLEVGATTDTVTVNAEAPLLKTESGEMSHQIDYSHADDLPIFTMGAGTGLGNIRDPLSVINLLPGAAQSTDYSLRINGMPSNSQAVRVEGQDATDGLWRQVNQINQQSADAIQEVSVQTSNFAAEYGQAGGGYINYTMKSGTNQYPRVRVRLFPERVSERGPALHRAAMLWRRAGLYRPHQERSAPQRLRLHAGRGHQDSETLQRQRQDVLLLQL